MAFCRRKDSRRRPTFGQVSPLEDPQYEELQLIQRSLHIDDAEEAYTAKKIIPYLLTNTKKVTHKVRIVRRQQKDIYCLWNSFISLEGLYFSYSKLKMIKKKQGE